MRSGIDIKKNWSFSIDQCWTQTLWFLVHFVDFLVILLRCDSFARIQEVVVDDFTCRQPNSDYDLLVQLWFKKIFWCFISVQLLCKTPSIV
uniref:Ovule protein n=1 Tax=Heterorhabditis bacteriophora TaxID=37862 RepID=A0A1I7WP86_HETBA